MSLTSTKKLESNKVELEITVGGEEFKAATQKAYEKMVVNMNVPGFRKGKAPRKMIEKMYGEGIFVEEAVNMLYPQAYEAAIEEAKIEPVDRAEIEVSDANPEGFSFKAIVTVKPEIELGDYKGIEVTKNIQTVYAADVNAEIENLRKKNAREIAVEDRNAKTDDKVVIDFEGFVDGVAFEGGKAEDYPLVLGSNQFIPGFEDQIVGQKQGEEFEVNVKFPED
ncbi:MAG: trigger factor, partial [Oscillospiraceae bacterium]